ncbi:MAG: hypothetical protein RR259_11245 [Odoribacter sp.]
MENNECVLLNRIAESYYKLLTCIDWKDQLMVSGLNEGLNKFISNAFLSSFPQGTNKYLKAHYISKEARKKINAGDFENLIFEHIIPKQKYIQEPCIAKAKAGDLNIEYVQNLLNKYWHIATITKEEDKGLPKFQMPKNWDGEDIFFRYRDTGIELEKIS